MNRDSLIEKLKFQVIPVLTESVSFSVKTKAASFINLVIPHGDCQIVITIYEETYDINLAAAIEDALLNMPGLAEMVGLIRVGLDGDSKFDELVLLPPSAHRFWKADQPALWESTYVCFPIRHYELPLKCTEQEVSFLRDKGHLNSSAWNRRIIPALYISYRNFCTDEGTVSESRKLGSYDDLSNALTSISERPHVENWISVESWRREVYKIQYEENLDAFIIVDSSSKMIALSSVDVASGIKNLFY